MKAKSKSNNSGPGLRCHAPGCTGIGGQTGYCAAHDVFHKSTSVESIAQRHLDIGSLAPQNVDPLDFHELGVWSIKAALEAAYEAGRAAAQAEAKEASRWVVRGDGTKVRVSIPEDDDHEAPGSAGSLFEAE